MTFVGGPEDVLLPLPGVIGYFCPRTMLLLTCKVRALYITVKI